MAPISKLLIEPLYRLIYGRPLEDRLPHPPDDEHAARRNDDGASGPWSDEARSLAAGSCRGLVLVADGIGGLDLCGTALRYVLSAEGLPYAIHVLPWCHGVGRWYADLTDVTNRDMSATLMSDAVRRFRDRQPGDPVFLVAKSGGSGVVVKALEQLEEASVERAILIAPALSPDYDLAPALRAVRGRDGGLLVAVRYARPGRGYPSLRYGRQSPDTQRGIGRISSPSRNNVQRPRKRTRVRQAAPGQVDPSDGRHRLSGRSHGTGFAGFSQKLRCAPLAGQSGAVILNRGPGSSPSRAGPIS
jgi:hypothetical protein